MHRKQKIAVVGGGIAGIVTAYELAKNHTVTLFEKNDYLGGHTHTIILEDGVDKGVHLDTGFIVMNNKTYPLFSKILDEWEVKTRYSDMSFGYWDRDSDFRYAFTNYNGIFAQRKNLIDLKFWKLSYELMQFFKKGHIALNTTSLDVTLRDFFAKEGFSKELQEKYLLPMGSAIWSIPSSKLLDFPVLYFLYWFALHGLLNISDRPKWKTVEGGSFKYVESFKKKYKGHYHLNAHIETIIRKDNAVIIAMKDGSILHYDKVVMATHGDQALKLLEKPSNEEVRLLGLWNYEENLITLHTDTAIMPKHKRAWASWNFHRQGNKDACLVTYHLNRLEGLKTHHDYFVTLNCNYIDKSKKIREMYYSHPIYTKEALKSQKELNMINGKYNSFFCGSYFGYGFHEDSVRSALDVAEKFSKESEEGCRLKS